MHIDKNDSDPLGTRMKIYERQETGRRFVPLIPIYARLDGRGFSKFTKGMLKPFDEDMHAYMIETTKHLVKETKALIGYTSSDEISLTWLAPEFESSIFFDGKISKLHSVLSGMATSKFMHCVIKGNEKYHIYAERLPHFDCRVFQLPNKTEVANTFLWRAQDASRNSITSAAQVFFSEKNLHKVNSTKKIEMLKEIGINYDYYSSEFKHGCFIRRKTEERKMTPEEFSMYKGSSRPDDLVTRSSYNIVENMPFFGNLVNREGFIFDNEEPKTV